MYFSIIILQTIDKCFAFIGAANTVAEINESISARQMYHKRPKSPTAETVGDSRLDIKGYPNVFPFVNSAFIAHAVHVRFCIFAGYEERREQQVIRT